MTDPGDTGLAAFEARMRAPGPNPAHHDVAALHDGWQALERPMRRPEDPDRPAAAQPLALFDPRAPLGARGTGCRSTRRRGWSRRAGCRPGT